MAVESAEYVSDLSASNPAGGDPKSQGDDHLRLIKAVLRTTFPNASRKFKFTTVNAESGGTSSITIGTADEGEVYPISANAGNRTVTLPSTAAAAADLYDGFRVTVIKTDSTSNLVTITPNGGSINGGTSYVLSRPGEGVELTYSRTASAWYVRGGGAIRTFAPPAAVTTDLSITQADDGLIRRVSAASVQRTVTLPTAVLTGFVVTIMKTDSSTNTVIVDGTSSAITNTTTNTITLVQQYDIVRLIYTGSGWLILDDPRDKPRIGNIEWRSVQDVPNTKYLRAEGQSLSKTAYEALYNLYSSNNTVDPIYGGTLAGSTFNLPDYRGQFIRVWDNAAGVDPNAASRTNRGDGTTGDNIGTKQASQVGPHTHDVKYSTAGVTSGTTQRVNVLGGGGTDTGSNAATTTGTSETRPVNITAVAMIRVLP